MAERGVPLVPEQPTRCVEPGCGGMLRRRYTEKWGGRYFYGCDQYPITGCSGSLGCHPDGRPLGKPADAETRKLRILAHEAFDQLWKEGYMTRSEAYEWLAEELGEGEVHIGDADARRCRHIVLMADAKYVELVDEAD